MKIHFLVEIEVDDRYGIQWIPYLRQQLHHQHNQNFSVTRSLALEPMDENMAQAIEQEAYETGHMDL